MVYVLTRMEMCSKVTYTAAKFIKNKHGFYINDEI